MAMASLGMYKNQLQELAQRSCFNLPSYSCLREGPDHAPRFKATVNFNGELFESPTYCTTLKQAEHAAAEVALIALSKRGGPSQSLAARILEETGVCKNLLQETAQRAGVSLPVYTTIRSGPRHLPVFKCLVEVAGMRFIGDLAKTKKQAEKNAAMAAWTALKRATSERFLELSEAIEEQEQRAERSNLWQHNNTSNHSVNLRSSRSRGWSQDRNLGGNYLASSSALDLPSDGEQSHSYGRNLTIKGRGVAPSQMRGGLPMRALEEHIRDEEEWLQLDTAKLGSERDFSSYGDRERLNSFGPGILESRRSSSFREEHSNSFSSAWDDHSRNLDARRSSSFREDQSSFGARILDSKRSSSFREDNSSFSISRILDSCNNSNRSSSFREDHRGICFREESNSFVPSVDKELSASFREDCSSLNALNREHSIAFGEADQASWNSSQIWLPQPQSQWWVDSPHGSSSGFNPSLSVLPTDFSSVSSSSSSSPPCRQTHSLKSRNINLSGDNFLLASNLAPPVKVRSMVAVCSSPSQYSDSIHSQFREAQVLRHSDRSETLDGMSMVNNPCFATNLAPPVRIRPMVAVCSAPPFHQDHHPPPQIREIVDNEAVARHMFSRMRL